LDGEYARGREQLWRIELVVATAVERECADKREGDERLCPAALIAED
jgi:hypothetical protein